MNVGREAIGAVALALLVCCAPAAASFSHAPVSAAAAPADILSRIAESNGESVRSRSLAELRRSGQIKTGSFDVASGAKSLWEEIQQEIAAIESDDVAEFVSLAFHRVRTDSRSRVVWSIACSIVILCFILLVMTVAGVSSLVVSAARSAAGGSQARMGVDALDETAKNGDEKQGDVPDPKSRSKGRWSAANSKFAAMVENGELEKAQAHLAARVESGGGSGQMLYLFAVCAARLDVEGYEQLVKEMFGDTKQAFSETYQHVGEIGRALAPKSFPVSKFPVPQKTFSERLDLDFESYGKVTEFGDAETLLDMLLAYKNMGEFGSVRQIIVTLLVHGNAKQRKDAIGFARKISDA